MPGENKLHHISLNVWLENLSTRIALFLHEAKEPDKADRKADNAKKNASKTEAFFYVSNLSEENSIQNKFKKIFSQL